jgi:hypothetical protein
MSNELNETERRELNQWRALAEMQQLLLRSSRERVRVKSNKPVEEPIKEFVESLIASGEWRQFQWITTSRLHELYREWCDTVAFNFEGKYQQKSLIAGLKSLRAIGWVDDHRTAAARGWTLVREGCWTLIREERS